MSEINPTEKEKAFKKANLTYVGTLGEPENLHIEPRGNEDYAICYEIPSSSPKGGKLKFETKIDALQVFTLIQEGGVASPKDEI